MKPLKKIRPNNNSENKFSSFSFQEPQNESETSLNNLPTGEEGIISRLPDNDMLTFLGLRHHKVVQVVTRQKFGGPIIVKTNGRYVALSRSLARQIYINKNSCGQAVMENNA